MKYSEKAVIADLVRYSDSLLTVARDVRNTFHLATEIYDNMASINQIGPWPSRPRWPCPFSSFSTSDDHEFNGVIFDEVLAANAYNRQKFYLDLEQFDVELGAIIDARIKLGEIVDKSLILSLNS